MKHQRLIKQSALIIAIIVLAANLAGSAISPPKWKLLPPFKSIWKITGNAMYGDSGLTENTYYYADAKSYGVYETGTGKLLWSRKFKREHTSLLTASDGKALFITIDGVRLLACRLSDGKTLWNTSVRNKFRPITTEKHLLLCELDPGTITAFNTNTFHMVWKCRLDAQPASKSASIPVNDLYPYPVGNDLVGINLINGSVVYRTTLVNPRPNPVRVGNRLYVTGYPIEDHQAKSGKLWALDANTGKQIWEFTLDGIPVDQPAITDDLVLVSTVSANELTAVNRIDGSMTWKRKLAGRMYVSAPLVVNNQILVNTEGTTYSFDHQGNQVFTYSRQDYIQDIPRISIIPDGLMIWGIGVGGIGLTMGEEEPSAARIPVLIKQMKNFNGLAMKELTSSHDPRAVNYLISQLKDQNASVWIKKIAYRNLARTGGRAGIKAVSAARDRSRSITPLYRDLAIEDSTGGNWIGKYSKTSPYACLLATHKDSNGVLWGLMRMELIGNRNDLWIAKYRDGKWQGFTFTGNSDEKPDLSTWFTSYVGNKLLNKDSDDDGLPDIIEQRFGTAIDNPDSDGDGLIDSIDKNPLTAPRELNDTEQLLAVVFEGYSHTFSRCQSPIVVEFPEGMQPFELFGYDGMIFAKTLIEKAPVFRLIGDGATTAKFTTPAYDLYGNAVKGNPNELQILWNDDHTEAMVGINYYVANLSAEGCDIQLRKIYGTWFVIRVKSIWIS